VSFIAITLCVASQRVFIVVSVYFVMTQSGNFWIHSRIRRESRNGAVRGSIAVRNSDLSLFNNNRIDFADHPVGSRNCVADSKAAWV
jgi:hypothetical protein